MSKERKTIEESEATVLRALGCSLENFDIVPDTPLEPHIDVDREDDGPRDYINWTFPLTLGSMRADLDALISKYGELQDVRVNYEELEIP